jgi:hypothetical protein
MAAAEMTASLRRVRGSFGLARSLTIGPFEWSMDLCPSPILRIEDLSGIRRSLISTASRALFLWVE